MIEAAKTTKQRILVLSDYYLPGYKSGGGMRTIVNMIEQLKDEFEFFVIARDHDGKLDREPYKTVEINRWNCLGDTQVYYLSKDNIKISKLLHLISHVKPDVIYSNSYFATLTFYLLILRSLGKVFGINIIIAPCGELSDGALRLNAFKKRNYIKVIKLFNLSRDIIWKASSELEKAEIEAQKGSGGKIIVAPDMLPQIIYAEYDSRLKPPKCCGQAKMIFLSRFMKKKNFNWLLNNLSGIRGDLLIDIYGPLEDSDYWQECEKLIEKLPDNIRVEAKGSVPHEQVLGTLVKYHFFIMPTLGENFGHIFLEALAAGCPLMISNRTPWLNLEEVEIGWDLPLEKPELWMEKLNHCISLDQMTYDILSAKAREFALSVLNDKNNKEATLSLLKIGLEKV